MRKSIFEIEKRIDIQEEFDKFMLTFLEQSTVSYHYNLFSYYHFLSNYVFNKWEYRDTFIDMDVYLEHIGLSQDIIGGRCKIKEVEFLNFLEFIANMHILICNDRELRNLEYRNDKIKNIISHNVPIILEKMNYEYELEGDRIVIRKRDADVDSILENVPDDISDLLLDYNDIRNNDKETKKTILKKIDLYLESGSNKKIFKNLDTKLLDSIGTIVNKMGINHPISEEPYLSFSDDELISWYDKCFKMMIHLIRSKDINEIKKERNQLVQQSEI